MSIVRFSPIKATSEEYVVPYVEQVCLKDSFTQDEIETAWTNFSIYCSSILGGDVFDYYAGEPQIVSPNRIRIGCDMVFVVHLDASPIRIERDRADINAAKLASLVQADMTSVGQEYQHVGVLLHHGQSGWGEA